MIALAVPFLAAVTFAYAVSAAVCWVAERGTRLRRVAVWLGMGSD